MRASLAIALSSCHIAIYSSWGLTAARGEQAAPASASEKVHAIEFFEAVPFKNVVNLSIFRGSDDVLYLAPAAIKVDQDSVNVVYRRNGHVADKGALNFTYSVALSDSASDKEVIALVKADYPDAKLSYLVPRLAHLEVSVLQNRHVVSPFSSAVHLGHSYPISIPLDRDALEFFLSGRSTDIPLGGITLVYDVRGYELGLDGKLSVVDRRIAIGGHINGGCARMAARFVNAKRGTIGCVVPLALSKEEIFEVQVALKKAGFYNGPLDGIVGRISKKAIRAAQKRLGVLQSGVLDYATRKQILTAALKSTEQAAAGSPVDRAP